MYRVLFIFGGHDSAYHLQEARQILEQQYPGQFELYFMDTYKIDDDPKEYTRCVQQAHDCDFIFLIIHGGLSYFKKFKDFFESCCGKKKIFINSGIEDEVEELMDRTGLTPREYSNIYRYYAMGGSQNAFNLILWLANRFNQGKFVIEEPIMPRWEGLYDPDEEITHEESHIGIIAGKNKPVIGVLFYTNKIQNNNLEHIDCIINQIKALGAVPLAVYTSITKNDSLGTKGIDWSIDNYLMKDGRPVVDAVINTAGFSLSIMANPGDGTKVVEESILEKLGVPVLQAMTTFFTLEQWEESLAGLDMMSLSSSVYQPEFDGQIISVPVAYSQVVKDHVGEKRIFRPIEGRVAKVCRLAVNWARLRYIPNHEKKVAIIFHNMPPRNDMIGCAFGLDSPAAVYNIVESLKETGIKTDYNFADSAEIINRIIDGVTNDTRWLPSEKILENSAAVVEGRRYRDWFSQFGQKVQEKMISDWGEPPGTFMAWEDKMFVPGILNGNIFIGLQPPRAFKEKAEESYHSTDMVCPHQYLGYYRWIKHVFGADIIIHMGTHGTLEWLPGKEIALSRDCYPDLAIDDLPHLYPYIINVPGEGVQAKRRSYAVILDHLIPSMVESDTYDELASVDDLIKEYYHAQKGSPGKIPYLQEQIWELAEKLELNMDLRVDKQKALQDFEAFIDELHTWVNRIKTSLIKDGLHVFGEVPPGVRFKNMLTSLVRLQNGEVPSLPESICRAKGLDYEKLKSDPTCTWEAGNTSLMILEEIQRQGTELMDELETRDYREHKITEVIEKVFAGIYTGAEGTDLSPLENCLRFICSDLKPRLEDTVEELKYLVKGVNGEFVTPGPSGCPTRGMARILPTGRNFFTIDPSAVPTRASWEVGKRLGDDLIQRYLKEEGKYPESVAIVIYAGETMKTCGDDIAEILYLLGIKPCWLGSTERVIGMEVIPLEQLGRPRIDVTLRISGLFRDTFPNLIGFIEDAITLTAGLEEDLKSNYVRKHVLQEVGELVQQGISKKEAEKQASLRIFGCPPGTYGAGVDILINSKKWQEVGDLGKVYTLWGGHAYGRKIHGDKKQEVFAHRLANTQITVKNESSMEIDMYDDDDYYNYHGGMIAAVRTFSGKKPRSYCGDSADPQRPEIRDTNEETARIMRARVLNPKWLEGLKKHGYKGAQEVSGLVDRVFGWDATADVVEDWMYNRITEFYVFNPENREWIQEQNPWALHNIVEKLMEANQRGMWNASEEDLEKLKKIYLEIEGDVEEYL
ncbi:cobaltochelatase subunit CobN [Candidatus Contubernalis alkaliaceticus]|uniref:cobaltochelatase subunit CobN n=1 Tax=Candidatus Contubernalis alkaliaceticus TaxID=338645 RepID=UPI001F4BF27D|nr:cobaltochelatase subunit CobN [Candidatus Contubernalis alkalaceticus]UNC93063.1 cobaltochelatase subunit CobN [Candidatus Contubernalis alkalaceticus]